MGKSSFFQVVGTRYLKSSFYEINLNHIYRSESSDLAIEISWLFIKIPVDWFLYSYRHQLAIAFETTGYKIYPVMRYPPVEEYNRVHVYRSIWSGLWIKESKARSFFWIALTISRKTYIMLAWKLIWTRVLPPSYFQILFFIYKPRVIPHACLIGGGSLVDVYLDPSSLCLDGYPY